METRLGEYIISDDAARIDPAVVKSFLSKSYWAGQRSQAVIEKSIRHSLCFGVYFHAQLVGFARVVTDWSTVYWLCDVWIEKTHRGQGLGKALVDVVVHHSSLTGQIGILATRDAHDLYERFGFALVDGRFMRRIPAPGGQ